MASEKPRTGAGETVEEREDWLSKIFDELSEKWTEAQREKVFLNRTVLLAAVERYYFDINGKKSEHGIPRADCHKRASFSVKWILQLRPIQFSSYDIQKPFVAINEKFAFAVACSFLEIKLAEVPESLIDHCLYHFRFKPFDPEAWSATFCMMEACGKSGLFPAISDFLEEKSRLLLNDG